MMSPVRIRPVSRENVRKKTRQNVETTSTTTVTERRFEMVTWQETRPVSASSFIDRRLLPLLPQRVPLRGMSMAVRVTTRDAMHPMVARPLRSVSRTPSNTAKRTTMTWRAEQSGKYVCPAPYHPRLHKTFVLMMHRVRTRLAFSRLAWAAWKTQSHAKSSYTDTVTRWRYKMAICNS